MTRRRLSETIVEVYTRVVNSGKDGITQSEIAQDARITQHSAKEILVALVESGKIITRSQKYYAP